MSSPYAERYGHTVTISVTERQFASLQESLHQEPGLHLCAFREAFFTAASHPETDENEK